MVALSGYGQRSDRDRAIAAGFDEYLVKPVSVEQIKRLFARVTPQSERRSSGE